METFEAIKSRRSVRKFKPDANVTDAQVRTLLEAAMCAPSACNTRPWEFIVVRNREKLGAIQEGHPFTGMLATAALAIVVTAMPQDDIAEGFYPQDAAAATQNILLAAQDMGLGTCWCGVYPKPDKQELLARILGIPEGKIPFNVIAVGVPDEAPAARGGYEPAKIRFVD